MPHTEYKYGIVIPARYKSSRYPGKPLIDLAGKSMIQRVWEICVAATDSDHVYIATDDERIQTHCQTFNAQVVMTSNSALTGTDRVAEVVEKLGLDYAINVQGDEPLLDPETIKKVQQAYEAKPGHIVNAMGAIETASDFNSVTIPKVVAAPNGHLLYMSRAPIPGNKRNEFEWGYKQVCIYAFPAEALTAFKATPTKTPLEAEEDIEILRFLEMGYHVHMIEVDGNSIAIDTPEDRERVLEVLNAQA